MRRCMCARAHIILYQMLIHVRVLTLRFVQKMICETHLKFGQWLFRTAKLTPSNIFMHALQAMSNFLLGPTSYICSYRETNDLANMRGAAVVLYLPPPPNFSDVYKGKTKFERVQK